MQRKTLIISNSILIILIIILLAIQTANTNKWFKYLSKDIIHITKWSIKTLDIIQKFHNSTWKIFDLLDQKINNLSIKKKKHAKK